MINRAGKIGGEGRRAHTARHISEMSPAVDPSCATSRSVKELRKKSRRGIVRSDPGVEECRQGLRVDALSGGAVVQAVARGLGDRRSLMTDIMNMITPTTA